jgi:hypothetical protein
MVLPADFLSPPSLARQRATDDALSRLAGDKRLGRTVIDESVLALVPERYRDKDLLSEASRAGLDTVVFFADGFESSSARRTAAAAGLEHEYAVPGTSIRIASKRDIAGLLKP